MNVEGRRRGRRRWLRIRATSGVSKVWSLETHQSTHIRERNAIPRVGVPELGGMNTIDRRPMGERVLEGVTSRVRRLVCGVCHGVNDLLRRGGLERGLRGEGGLSNMYPSAAGVL